MIKAIKDFNLNGIFYEAGDNVKVNSKDELIKLNERGFIEPLTPKQLQNYFEKNTDKSTLFNEKNKEE